MHLDWVAALIAGFAILSTVVPLLRHDAWWIRWFEFPRIQLATMTVVVLLAYAMFHGWSEVQDKILLAALSICFAFQLIRIAPYTPIFPKQLQSTPNHNKDDTIGLFVTNVLTPNRNAEALLRRIKESDPDIVLAVETDVWWQTKLSSLEATHPHSVKYPLDNLYGMNLYSRLPLMNAEVLFLVENDVPSIHTDVILRSGHQVELHCVHPAPPSPTENATSAERDAELLIIAKTINAQERSVVVMGDLNDVAWSATTRLFQKLSGLLDPRVGRGMYSTFHARYPFMRWPLDHVFCSADFTLISMARLSDIGSDHFPIHVVLQYTPIAKAEHEPLEAVASEREWAEEKIEKVDTNEEALQLTGVAERASA